MLEVLVNRLRGLNLPKKSVVRLTDRPDMTIPVKCGRKTTTSQQQGQCRNSNPNHKTDELSSLVSLISCLSR